MQKLPLAGTWAIYVAQYTWVHTTSIFTFFHKPSTQFYFSGQQKFSINIIQNWRIWTLTLAYFHCLFDGNGKKEMNFMYKLSQLNWSIVIDLVLSLFVSTPLANIHFLNSMYFWPCIIDINKVDDQIDATINNNLLIFKLAQHVLGNSLPILRSARLWFTACGIMSCIDG